MPMPVPAAYHLALSAALFTLGMVGVLVRRSALIVFMSIELMLNAVNLSLVTFARQRGSADGQLLVFFILVVAAVEVVIGLAIIVDIFRSKRTVDIDEVDLLRG
jgi:NADH-quinone oxidoreductase subunit K